LGYLLPPRAFPSRAAPRGLPSSAVHGLSIKTSRRSSHVLSLPYRVFQRLYPCRSASPAHRPKTTRRLGRLPHTVIARRRLACSAARLSDAPEEATFRSARQTPLMGSCTLLALKHAESTCEGRSHATLPFRPQVFSTSRRFAPRHAPRPCFMPLTRTGFCYHPPGAFLPGQPRCLVDILGPLTVTSEFRHRGKPRRLNSEIRFQGVAPPGNPSPALGCYSSHGLDPLMSFPLFQVFAPPAVGLPSQPLRSCP
jgi:hypothetical protein